MVSLVGSFRNAAASSGKRAFPPGRLLQLLQHRADETKVRSLFFLRANELWSVFMTTSCILQPKQLFQKWMALWQGGLVQSKIDVLVQVYHAPGKRIWSLSKVVKLHHLVFVPKGSGIIPPSRFQQLAHLLGWSSDKNSSIFRDSRCFLRRRLSHLLRTRFSRKYCFKENCFI